VLEATARLAAKALDANNELRMMQYIEWCIFYFKWSKVEKWVIVLHSG